MGKKKFIDKKKSATFQLYPRDSSSFSNEPGSDRVFVRVDDNPYGGGGGGDDSIFADAVEDANGGGEMELAGLPEAVRREILELGFPDDGYNYLNHMRENKNSGGGVSYFNNPQFKVEQLPLDVKIYNASKVPVPQVKEKVDEEKIYTVAAKTYTIRSPKAIDPDVASLLEDDDLSRFGSDVEDLEEDFILQANYMEGVTSDQELDVDQRYETLQKDIGTSNPRGNVTNFGGVHEVSNHSLKYEDDSHYEKPRGCRLLDEQFDMLESQEYGSDSYDDDYYDGPIEDGDEALKDKLYGLYRVLKDRGGVDEMELDGKYRAPTDILQSDEMSHDTEIHDTAVEVLRQTKEYGKNFEMDDYDGKNLVIVEESSDESEKWDCETIITTYSNFDNHPGKIKVPENPRRKKLSQTVADALNAGAPMISLGGKQKLPLNYLPYRKGPTEKVKDKDGVKIKPKKKEVAQETKEEKKERKIADFWKEALILSSLHHPNVVSFYGIVRDGPDGSLATVTEFMINGSLKQFLQKKDRTIDRRKRLIIAMDSAFGMEYLHGKNIVHFDLKCENLLVNMREILIDLFVRLAI